MKVYDSQSGQVDLSTLPQQPPYMKEAIVPAWCINGVKKCICLDKNSSMLMRREGLASSWSLHEMSPRVT